MNEQVVDRNGLVPSEDGVPIAFDVHGSGEVGLVFVHGWSCRRHYFDNQVAPFAHRACVVLIDLAGHGDSGRGRSVQTMSGFGRDVTAVIDHLNLRQVILVGHSMGGDVILETASQRRRLVRGLVWIDAYRELPVIRSAAEIEELVAPFRRDFVGWTGKYVRELFAPGADLSLVDRIAAEVSSAPPSIAVPALEAAFHFAHEVPAALEHLQLPVSAINPDDGSTDVASLARHGVSVHLLPDVGHFPFLEAPHAFNSLLGAVIEPMLNAL